MGTGSDLSEHYIAKKQKKKRVKFISSTHTTFILEYFHSDILGHATITTLRKNKYFLVFTYEEELGLYNQEKRCGVF